MAIYIFIYISIFARETIIEVEVGVSTKSVSQNLWEEYSFPVFVIIKAVNMMCLKY